MSFLELLLLALSLAMDAFAVSIFVSAGLGNPSPRQKFRLAFHFGLFQALMPILGWMVGRTVVDLIADVDHWVAFGLLAVVGGKAVYSGFVGQDEASKSPDPTRKLSLIALSVATSIDALAVGLSIAIIGVDIWFPALVIGLVAGGMTLLGMELGRQLGARLGKVATIFGGLVLIGIGFHILLQHLLAA